MSLIPQEAAVPPGGFHFVDHSTGVPVRIEGGNYVEVAQKLLKHRLANSKPPGEPAKEIADYVCGNWPGWCRDTNPPPRLPDRINGAPMSSQVMAWIASFYDWARYAPKVAEATAQRRAEICARCPHNREYRLGCSNCVENIERLSFVWRAGRYTSFDKDLLACAVTGQHNATAVHASNLPDLSPAAMSQFPAQCWRRTAS